ncbi:serine/threonine protein kinase [Anabaena sp. 90]|jgi:serine/threonine protein kinase|uniref:serine/threonine protein kinase n=1 Tax=Anabaena sp. 90 TaxID=46234 RepID=UPI00029B6B2E|nr:serine/threonine-protein kinase [Anabaena sp. 90]AFW94325.1 serine/threonine protein kinase [Anabaena sp. 90]MBO1052491.1 serine/threonine protein kinase [Dolichospermum sp. DET73]
MEVLHQAGEIINQRYRILRILGQGGVGITYAAIDLENSEEVALKVLSLRRMSDWKKIELFEREAKILSQLNHSAIPHYLDYFQIDTNSDRSFYIVQQLAPGNSLATLVENGWLPDEGKIKQIAIQMLEILTYLHSLTPPVIHRDIKPQNIILSHDKKELFLVDFGAVADTYHNTVTGGSTVVGTFGYMAPEQFRGQAFPSTDLYGLGTTLLFLLTGKSPTDLPQRQLKIDFRPYVDISKDFANWLEQMLEPVSADRFSSAEAALATLLGQIALIPRQPKKSNVVLSKTENSLIITIPPGCFYNNYSFLFLFFSIIFYSVFVLIYWIIVVDYLGGWGLLILLSLLLVPLFVIPGLIIPVIKLLYKLIFSKPLSLFITSFMNSVSTTLLQIDQDYISIEIWLLGWCIPEIKIPKSDIISVGFNGMMGYKFSNLLILYIVRSYSSDKNGENIQTFEKKRHFRFGAFLTQQEKEWLVWEIKNTLN